MTYYNSVRHMQITKFLLHVPEIILQLKLSI